LLCDFRCAIRNSDSVFDTNTQRDGRYRIVDVTDAGACQSCGMPMDEEERQGTELDGTANREFCTYCYQNGVFTNPGLSLDGMVSHIAQVLGKRLTPEERNRSREFLSTLERRKS